VNGTELKNQQITEEEILKAEPGSRLRQILERWRRSGKDCSDRGMLVEDVLKCFNAGDAGPASRLSVFRLAKTAATKIPKVKE
jgi:hypothetical protein